MQNPKSNNSLASDVLKDWCHFLVVIRALKRVVHLLPNALQSRLVGRMKQFDSKFILHMFVTNSFFASQWTLLPRLIQKWFCFDLPFPTFFNQLQGILEHLFPWCWIIIDNVVDLSAITVGYHQPHVILDLTNWRWSGIYHHLYINVYLDDGFSMEAWRAWHISSTWTLDVNLRDALLSWLSDKCCCFNKVSIALQQQTLRFEDQPFLGK